MLIHLNLKLFSNKLIRNYSSYIKNSSNCTTIYGQATFPAKSALAIIRVSGPKAYEVIEKMTLPVKINKNPTNKLLPRHLHYRKIINPKTNSLIDMGLISYFQAPNSFTGQDVVELNLHGSKAVINSVLSGINQLNNLSDSEKLKGDEKFLLAEPGEFTKRAFMSGKLDLTEAEGILALLDSETEAQRYQAIRVVEGEISRLYKDWRIKLINMLSDLEAYIDFGDDELDLNSDWLNLGINQAKNLKIDIEKYLNDGRKGEILNEGIQLMILGRPNAGKSSLLNKLVRSDKSIVSNIPGTTRDLIRHSMDLGGYPIQLIDSAGLRKETFDPIEQEGINRAISSANKSHILLMLIDGLELIKSIKLLNELNNNNNNDTLLNPNIPKEFINDNKDQLKLIIINKIDNLTDDQLLILKRYLKEKLGDLDIFEISCLTDVGLNEFINQLIDKIKYRFDTKPEEPIAIVHARHRFHLNQLLIELSTFLELTNNDLVDKCNLPVMLAEHLRTSAHHLAHLTGDIHLDNVLDDLFSRFCIGK